MPEQPSMSSSAWVDHLQQRSAQIRDHIEMELSKEDPVPSDAFECPYSIDTPVMLRRPTRHQKCLSPYEGGWLIKSVISPSTVVIIRTDGSGEKVINIDLLKYDPAADVCADDSCASVPADNDLDDCVVLLPLHELLLCSLDLFRATRAFSLIFAFAQFLGLFCSFAFFSIFYFILLVSFIVATRGGVK
eukprot:scpid18698/ scgid17030/ 